MIGATLALFLVLGQAPSDSPTALVEQLGSPRFAEREKASEALARLGAGALPALRAALDTKDPEVRARAAAVVEKTEALLLTQPTMVTLDIRDRPLTEAVGAIGDQAGIKLALTPEVSPAWQARVTLLETAPLPFWKALDRLCVAGNLQYNLGMQGSYRSRQPILTLFAGRHATSGPISDLGPFRVQVTNLHFQRDVTFAAGPRPSEQFYVQVQVAAEPRLSVSEAGKIQVLEAVDDRGQSLLLPDGGISTRQSAYFGMSPGPTLQMQVHLKRPTQPGATIRKLRGTIPLAVATRKADPLVVPLIEASGKSFRNEETSLTVQKVWASPNAHQTMIEMIIRSHNAAGVATHGGMNRAGHFSIARNEMHHQQIEVIDAKGQTIPCYPTSIDPEGTRVVLTVAPPDGVAEPTELRYYNLALAATEVPFEFADIMLP